MADREREVLERAIDLHTQAERAREAEQHAEAHAAAARELGVPEPLVLQARRELAARDAQALTRRRVALGVAGLALAGGLSWAAFAPPAVLPIVDGLDGPGWLLDKDPASQASLTVVRGQSGGALKLGVDHFVADADSKFHASVDRTQALPDIGRHRSVTLRVRGKGLGAVRLYLEGAERRWRSAPIPVSAEWTEHTLDLSAFSQLRRTAEGTFRGEGLGHPVDVLRWSLKVGHFVNPVDAKGEVELDELRFE